MTGHCLTIDYSAIHGLNFAIELAVLGQDGITADPYTIEVTTAELQDSRTMPNNAIVTIVTCMME